MCGSCSPAWSCHHTPCSMHPSLSRVSLGRVPHPVLQAPSTGALPWIVERLLEGNSLTFLLLCMTLPGSAGTTRSSPAAALCQPRDTARLLPRHPGLTAPPGTPGEQIRAALALAEQVKGVNKSVSPTHWDPAWEVAARREKIRGLRTELQEAAGRPEQHRVLVQLQRALRELQVGDTYGHPLARPVVGQHPCLAG